MRKSNELMKRAENRYESGVLPPEMAQLPPELALKRGGCVVIECPERIPCDPCHTGCPTGAVLPFADINDTPRVDGDKCTGCALCVAKCPGLACFVVDISYGGEDEALIRLPYEMFPRPLAGSSVDCTDRTGRVVAGGTVESVREPAKDRTAVVSVVVPRGLAGEIRGIEVRV